MGTIMDQDQRLNYLIDHLLMERGNIGLPMPESYDRRRSLLRALMNTRLPGPLDPAFIQVQDRFLLEEGALRGRVDPGDLRELSPGISLWQGDITTLSADGIVNAANSGLTGCYVPGHRCIDNAIHSYAGLELRNECARIMEAQGHEEPTGRAKMTPGYCLPCQYVIHTVGPIVSGPVLKRHRQELESCYRSCLELALEKGLRTLAFCCISTGEFGFPQAPAARIAVDTVKGFLAEHPGSIKVIFDVFKKEDYDTYYDLLTGHRGA